MFRRFISQFPILNSIVFFLFNIFCTCSCNTSTVLCEKSFDVEYSSTPLNLSKYFDTCEVIVLDTIAKSVINNIDRLLFTDDRIIVVDRIGNKCVSFDMEGNFIGSTQKYIGKSEREYIHMIDAALDICDNHVYMYNDFPGSIFILDTDLNLISSIKIDFPMKEFTVSDNEIYFVRNEFDIHDNFSICVVDKNRLTGTPIELQKLKKNVHGVRGSGKSLVNSNGCYVTLPFDNRIHYCPIKVGKLLFEIIEI